MLLRDGPGGLEVLLVQRSPEQRFLGGAWVFPGGAMTDAGESPAATALRELREETGIRLGGVEVLVPFSRWITPTAVSIRFDTHFFVAQAPVAADAVPDGSECVDVRWLQPADAMAAGDRGEMLLVLPTIKHLEELAGLRSVSRALDVARARKVTPVLPRMVVRDGSTRMVLPGEAGYGE